MQPFPAFFVIIKTHLGKVIGCFVDSKFESTRGMECKVNGKKYTGKLINDEIIYYFLDDELVKCRWKHEKKSVMDSNDSYFLSTSGIGINNNRSDDDFA